MAEYFLSIYGDNSNPGISASPSGAWRTFAYANTKLLPGDTLFVLPGTYEENVNLTCSGNSLNLVTIRAEYYDNLPIIRASYSNTVVTINSSYITFSGFNVQSIGNYDNIYIANNDNINIEKNIIDGSTFGHSAINVYSPLATNINILRNKIKNPGSNGISINASGCNIYYNVIDGFQRNSAVNGQIYIGHSGNFKIYNNTLVGAMSHGILINDSLADVDIKNNIIAHYGVQNRQAYGIISYSVNAKYSYNLITSNGYQQSYVVSGGTDEGNNLLGSGYQPEFQKHRNKAKVLLISDDKLIDTEEIASLASVYGLKVNGALSWNNNLTEDNFINRCNALLDNGHNIINHSRTHPYMTDTLLGKVTYIGIESNPKINIDKLNNTIYLNTDEGIDSKIINNIATKTVANLNTELLGTNWYFTLLQYQRLDQFLNVAKDSLGYQFLTGLPLSYTIELEPVEYYNNELQIYQDYLEGNLTNYSIKFFVYPYWVTNNLTIDNLLRLGFKGARCGINVATGTDLRYLKVFEITNTSITYLMGDGTENSIRKSVRQFVRMAATTPVVAFITTHTLDGADPTPAQYSILLDELSKSSEYIDVITVKQLIEELYDSGNYEDVLGTGKVLGNNNFTDFSDYTLKEISPCIHNGIDLGLEEDILGRELTSNPSIGAYETIGGFTMADKYISFLAAGGGTGTIVSPFTLAEGIAYINAGSLAAGEIMWVKADGTYLTSGFEITHTTSSTNPAKFCGYLSSIGDNGRATIKRNGGAGNLCYFNGHYWHVKNFNVDGSNGGTINVIGKNSVQYINVESYAAGSTGFQEGKTAYCYSHNNGSIGFYNHYLNHACIAVSNGGIGFQPLSVVSHCISKSNVGYNYSVGNNAIVIKSISDGGSNHGFYAVTQTGSVIDCVAINAPAGKNGLYITGAVCYGMGFYGNTADCNDITQVNGNIVYTNPGFNNPSGLDYTRLNNVYDGQGVNPGLLDTSIDYNIDLGIGRNLPVYAAVTDVRVGVNRGDGTIGTLDLPSVSDVQYGVQFDNLSKTGIFAFPTVSDVRVGVTYGAAAEYTGSLDLPGVEDVEKGVNFDSLSKQGTLKLPLITDVRLGSQYGASDVEFTGSLNLPSVNDVQDGVTFDNATKTGLFVSPTITNVKSGIAYGAAGEYVGTYNEDYPAVANVRDGIIFGNGTYEGSLDLPSINDVQEGVVFDGLSKTGTFESPIVANVRDGITYGANGTEFTGILDIPSEDDVRNGTTFDNLSKTGNLELPIVANVKSGVLYGTSGLEFTGSYDEDYPIENNVRDGISFGNGAYEGTLELPSISDVRLSTVFGANGTEFTGTLNLPSVNDVQESVAFDNGTKVGVFVSPTEANVNNGITYGANAEYTGTLELEFNSTFVILSEDSLLNLIQKEAKNLKFLVKSTDGQAMNVSGATITFYVKRNKGDTSYITMVADNTIDKTLASTGTIIIPVSTTDLDFYGDAYGLLKIQFSASSIEKYYFNIRVEPSEE